MQPFLSVATFASKGSMCLRATFPTHLAYTQSRPIVIYKAHLENAIQNILIIL